MKLSAGWGLFICIWLAFELKKTTDVYVIGYIAQPAITDCK